MTAVDTAELSKRSLRRFRAVEGDGSAVETESTELQQSDVHLCKELARLWECRTHVVGCGDSSKKRMQLDLRSESAAALRRVRALRLCFIGSHLANKYGTGWIGGDQSEWKYEVVSSD